MSLIVQIITKLFYRQCNLNFHFLPYTNLDARNNLQTFQGNLYFPHLLYGFTLNTFKPLKHVLLLLIILCDLVCTNNSLNLNEYNQNLRFNK